MILKKRLKNRRGFDVDSEVDDNEEKIIGVDNEKKLVGINGFDEEYFQKKLKGNLDQRTDHQSCL